MKQRGFAHLLLLIPVLFIVAGGIFYLYNTRNKTALVNTHAEAVDVVEPSPQNLDPVPSSSVTKNSTNDTYRSEKYGYSFEYPSEYHLFVSPPNYLFLKKAQEDTKVLAEIGIKHDAELVFPNPDKYISKIANLKNESFDSYVSKVLLVDCYSLQLEEETYCNSVVSQEPYTNPNGLSGYRVVLHLVHAQKDRNGKRTVIDQSDWGPIYIFDLTDRGLTDTRALVFKPQLTINSDITAVDAELKKLVDTVKF